MILSAFEEIEDKAKKGSKKTALKAFFVCTTIILFLLSFYFCLFFTSELKTGPEQLFSTFIIKIVCFLCVVASCVTIFSVIPVYRNISFQSIQWAEAQKYRKMNLVLFKEKKENNLIYTYKVYNKKSKNEFILVQYNDEIYNVDPNEKIVDY